MQSLVSLVSLRHWSATNSVTVLFVQAHINLGLSYSQMGLPYKAIATFEDGIKQLPDDCHLYFNLGIVYQDLGTSLVRSDACNE